jgi:hypothetical protein
MDEVAQAEVVVVVMTHLMQLLELLTQVAAVAVQVVLMAPQTELLAAPVS